MFESQQKGRVVDVPGKEQVEQEEMDDDQEHPRRENPVRHRLLLLREEQKLDEHCDADAGDEKQAHAPRPRRECASVAIRAETPLPVVIVRLRPLWQRDGSRSRRGNRIVAQAKTPRDPIARKLRDGIQIVKPAHPENPSRACFSRKKPPF